MIATDHDEQDHDVWTEPTVAEIAASIPNAVVGGPFGSNLGTNDYVATGTPVIRGENMGRGRWVTGPFAFVTPEKAAQLSVNGAGPGDIVFTQRGTVGQVAVVPPAPFGRYLLSQSQMKVTVDPARADPMFVYYAFRTQDQRAAMLRTAIQTGVPHTNLGQLRRTTLHLPSPRRQRTTALLLCLLDDKIESNGRLVAATDALIAALVAAAEDATWSLTPVSTLARFVNGGAFTNRATGAGRMVLRIAELNSGPSSSTVFTERDVPDDQVARPGDLLMSWSGSLDVYRWYRDEAIVNQHIFKVISDGLPSWLVYTKLKEAMPAFQQIAAGKATTMGHIKRHHLEDTKVPIPRMEAILEMDRRCGVLWTRALVAERESLALGALRDLLVDEMLSPSGGVAVTPAPDATRGS